MTLREKIAESIAWVGPDAPLITQDVMDVVEAEVAHVRTKALHEAAEALEADRKAFLAEEPEEPENSPYMLGWKDAAELLL
jgi:nitrate reductase alpha subunit